MTTPALPPTQLYIGGKWQPAAAGEEFDAYDPRTGAVVARVQQATQADVDAAVDAAQLGLKTLSKLSPLEKSALLHRLADLVEKHVEELAYIETLNLGMPIGDARGNTLAGVMTLRYYAGWTDKLTGDTVPSGTPGFLNYTRKVPIGVVGHIVPWNYPILEMIKMIAPCIAAGCTSVYKTNEWTPLSVCKMLTLIDLCEWPAGLINVVHGGVPVGEMLSSHPRINKIVFTGSVRAGRAIQISAAQSNLKPVCLELGGKSANIAFSDADLEQAAPNVLMAFTANAGQCCCAGTRVLVHTDIYDALVAKVVELAGALAVGDPMLDSTTIGPLCNPNQLKRVLAMIETGKSEARLVCGGGRIGESGYYVQPTVFADVTNAMAIAREEIFGPVGVFIRFSTPEEAVAIANDSDYGLAAGVWTASLDTSLYCTENLQAGTVWVNGMMGAWGYNMPFGGPKLTGNGQTNGKAGLDQYLLTKSITIKSHRL